MARKKTVKDLLTLSRRGTYPMDRRDLNEVVKSCASSPAIRKRCPATISLELDLVGRDRRRLRQGEA